MRVECGVWRKPSLIFFSKACRQCRLSGSSPRIVELLYSALTPERLHVRGGVRLVVIDEALCISEISWVSHNNADTILALISH
jgi:hypothetical protein